MFDIGPLRLGPLRSLTQTELCKPDHSLVCAVPLGSYIHRLRPVLCASAYNIPRRVTSKINSEMRFLSFRGPTLLNLFIIRVTISLLKVDHMAFASS